MEGDLRDEIIDNTVYEIISHDVVCLNTFMLNSFNNNLDIQNSYTFIIIQPCMWLALNCAHVDLDFQNEKVFQHEAYNYSNGCHSFTSKLQKQHQNYFYHIKSNSNIFHFMRS